MLAILITGVPPPAASLGLEAGLDVKVVSDRLGRSTTRITQDLYTHVRYEVDAAAAARSSTCSGRNALPRGAGR
jgi:integrase